jgi:photosystem II stability/assembly factor-like uncharacterized protein
VKPCDTADLADTTVSLDFTFSNLSGVAVTSSRDCWAVGNDSKGRFLILQWNGRSWSRVPSPSPRLSAQLYAVSATSARNALAVSCCLLQVARTSW